ncbi:MAG: hypothetical protein PHP88_07840 [bacterium]|nr:hypothetical protein [bacterium]
MQLMPDTLTPKEAELMTDRHRVVEELKASKERHLQQKQKMENLGTLAAEIAHDFNNLLIINALEAIGDRGGVITVSVGATRCDEEYLQQTELPENLVSGCT